MSSDKYRDRVIALSGLMQAVTLVQDVAETGHVNTEDMETLLTSLLITDPPNTETVYGDIARIRTGIVQFNEQLAKKKDQASVVKLRYAVSLLHLERKLSKQPEMLDLISREIQQIPQQIEYFGSISSPQVIARFADIYQRTVSQLKPQVQVYGDSSLLQQPDNANRVRALLLAGIRSVVLWRQDGGRRWQFLLASKHMLDAGADLYQEI